MRKSNIPKIGAWQGDGDGCQGQSDFAQMDILENGQVDKLERLEFCLPEMKTDPNLRLKDNKCLGISSQ